MVRRIFRGFLWSLAVLALVVGCQSMRLSGRDMPDERRSEALRVATHNVHYILMRQANGPWSVGDWERRKHAMDRAFKDMAADLVAFQEMESFAGGNSDDVNLARSWLLQNNPGYAAAAVGDWRTFPSTQPVFYRTDRLEPLEQGWFFFSETPDAIYSRTFNGSYPAFASWVRFRRLTDGATFRVINVHLDYGSRENRLRSADLIRDRVRPWAQSGERVVLLGDLNARRGSAVHRRLEDAGLTFLRIPGATFHFNRGVNLYGAIDHVGVAGFGRTWGEPVVIRERYDGVWPSDHYPVVVDLVVP